MKLYEIADKYETIWDTLESIEDDPELKKDNPNDFDDRIRALIDTLEDVNDKLDDKVDAYAAMVHNLKDQEKLLKQEQDRLKRRADAAKKKREFLQGSLQDVLEQIGKKKITTTNNTVWIQKNQPHVEWIEGQEIPDEYLIPQDPKKDTAKVSKDLKAGKELPFAQLKPSEGIRFRFK